MSREQRVSRITVVVVVMLFTSALLLMWCAVAVQKRVLWFPGTKPEKAQSTPNHFYVSCHQCCSMCLLKCG